MKIHSLIGPASPWRFFTLALGLSWLFWIPVVLSGRNVMVFPFALLGLSGLLGPALAEIILIFRTGSKEEQHDYWQRVFDFRRIRGGWWAAILLTFPVINTLAMLLNVWTGGAWPEFDQARRIFSQPWTILPYALFILFFGPVPEELGWRGYALDSLQARWQALASSLILGMVWSLWHLPLFFMAGTAQHDQIGFGTLGFWSYMAGPVVISILFTWIYNHTQRSTLSAILFHFMINFSEELFSLPERAQVMSLPLTIILALLVTLTWGPGTLARRPGPR